jgi:hypothetical protein
LRGLGIAFDDNDLLDDDLLTTGNCKKNSKKIAKKKLKILFWFAREKKANFLLF